MNAIAWHPNFTTTSSAGSPYKNYIATGTNESTVNVVDLNPVLGNSCKIDLFSKKSAFEKIKDMSLNWNDACNLT